MNTVQILEQLKAYCACVGEDVTEADVADLVDVISMATCWQVVPCETFLKGARREVIDLPSCADCPITFEPYYQPFDISTFKFYLVKVEGIEETTTEITDFRYSPSSGFTPLQNASAEYASGFFRVDPGLPSCRCGCNPCCGCPPEYKLVVEYEAGYDELPNCVLPVMCNVLEVIMAKRNCDCANDCGCEGQEEKVKYATGDVVSVALETDIGKILVENYKNQLALISLCRERKYLWGVIV